MGWKPGISKRKPGPYQAAYKPLRLKRLLLEAGVSHNKVAVKMGEHGYPCSRSVICIVVNKGYIPEKETEKFKAAMEAACVDLDIPVDGMWESDEEERRPEKNAQPRVNHYYRYDEMSEEGGEAKMNYTKEFLEEEHLKAFGLKDDPFFDLDDHSTIWMSPQLKAAERHVMRTIKGRGIMAVTGDFGMGKSTFLRHLLGKLMRDPQIRIIMPDRQDRELMTGMMFTNGIIRSTLGTEGKLPRGADEKDAMAKRILEGNMRSGVYTVLIVDEAHDLKEKIFIALKRLWDSGAIFKLIAIILVGAGGQDDRGQVWGLRGMIERNTYLREFAERCYMMDLGKLNGNMVDYLDFRFRRVGRPVREVFSDDAVALLSEKARTPQLANNIAMRALQIAYRDGRTRVEWDHVNDV